MNYYKKLLFQFIFLLVLSFGACADGPPSANSDSDTNSPTANTRPMEKEKAVQQLLERLNYWVAQGGDPKHRPEDLKSTGESNAAFELIWQQLEAEGVELRWENNQYVIVE